MTGTTLRRIFTRALLAVGAVASVQTAADAGEERPTLVSVRLRDVPVKDAYEMLGKQAGVRIGYDWGKPSDTTRVTATIIQEPFWSAMAKVGKAADMQLTSVRREPTREVSLIGRSLMSNNPAVGTSVDGLFIGTLYDSIDSSVLHAPPDVTRKYASTLTIGIRGEPKLKAMLFHSMRIDEFVDETGRPIDAKLLYKSLQFRDGVATAQIHLAERAWPRRVGRLRVSGKALAAGKTEVATVNDLMSDNPLGTSAGGFRIETTTRPGARGRKITLTMSRESSIAQDWLRPASRLELLDPIVLDKAGRKITCNVYDRDWFGRSCRFQLEAEAPQPRKNEPPFGPPQKLLMEIPTNVAEYDVKFEFTDAKLF